MALPQSVIETLDDLRIAAQAMAAHSSELAALAGGLALNDALGTELVVLDANGVGTLDAQVPAASVAVTNLGTMRVTVAAGGPASAPPRSGAGAFVVGPGAMVCMPLVGTAHSFYGRAGEVVAVTRYTRPQPPAAGQVMPAPWFVVDVATPAADHVAYTAPHGQRAEYGGFSARETTGATPAVFRVREATIAGRVLSTVGLAPSESRDDPGIEDLLASSSVFYEHVSGTLECSLRVR